MSDIRGLHAGRLQLPDVPSCNRVFATEIRRLSGGIAQLVERQLCKLDVRGSNPLASRISKEILELDLKSESLLLDALAGA